MSLPRGPRRREQLAWEWLVYAALLLVLAYWVQGYEPTKAAKARELEVTLGGYAAFCVIAALVDTSAWLSRVSRRGRRLIGVAFWLWPGLALFFMILNGGGLLFVMSHALGVGTAVVELLVLAALVGAARRGRISWRAFRLTLALGIFCNALLNIALLAWLWSNPAAEACEAPVSPYVERISPQSLPDGRSQAYSVELIEAEQLLAVSFKMSGNLTIFPWNIPAANKVLLYDLTRAEAAPTRVVDLTGPEVPLYFTWCPTRRELLVVTLGEDGGHVDFIDLSRWPQHAEVVRHEAVDFPVHRPFYSALRDEVVILSLYGEVAAFDYETWRPTARYPLRAGHEVLVTGGRLVPGRTEIVVSGMSTELLRTDWTTARTAAAPVTFNLGDMFLEPGYLTSYSADFALRAINVVDVSSMTPMRRLPVDYAPRGFAADAGRDLLLVGDWFGGRVMLYSATDLSERAPPVPLSTYLRSIAFDPGRGDAFVASKCGAYRVHVDAWLAQHPP